MACSCSSFTAPTRSCNPNLTAGLYSITADGNTIDSLGVSAATSLINFTFDGIKKVWKWTVTLEFAGANAEIVDWVESGLCASGQGFSLSVSTNNKMGHTIGDTISVTSGAYVTSFTHNPGDVDGNNAAGTLVFEYIGPVRPTFTDNHN